MQEKVEANLTSKVACSEAWDEEKVANIVLAHATVVEKEIEDEVHTVVERDLGITKDPDLTTPLVAPNQGNHDGIHRNLAKGPRGLTL